MGRAAVTTLTLRRSCDRSRVHPSSLRLMALTFIAAACLLGPQSKFVWVSRLFLRLRSTSCAGMLAAVCAPGGPAGAAQFGASGTVPAGVAAPCVPMRYTSTPIFHHCRCCSGCCSFLQACSTADARRPSGIDSRRRKQQGAKGWIRMRLEINFCDLRCKRKVKCALLRLQRLPFHATVARTKDRITCLQYE